MSIILQGDDNIIKLQGTVNNNSIAAHAVAIDPHADRSYAYQILDDHTTKIIDPHGDRAYATAQDAIVSSGGATASDQLLKTWTESGAYELTAITYNVTYTTVMASGVVKWPDGSAGALTVTALNTTYLKETAYTITHTISGKTVTQAEVTLNVDGNITVKPALTVA